MKALTLFLLGMASSALVAQTVGESKPLTAEQIAQKSVKVAAVQITGPWQWQVPTGKGNDTAAPLIPYIDRAGAEKVDLIVFPELYLGMFRVPSPQTKAIAAAAKRNQIYVMVGCFEVINEKGEYGNSTLIFDRSGEIVGRYFKAYQAVGGPPYSWPPTPDDPEWLMNPGEETPVFDLDFGRVGILTCYDGYFPELFRLLSLKGAEIIIWPNARHGFIEDYIVKANVHQNYVHMVTSNKAFGTGTMIATWPKGIQEITEAKEGYISGTLDLATLRNARINAREFRQRRPAMYQELAKDWVVSENYGVPESGVKVPVPSAEAKAKILKNSAIEVK